MKKTLVTLCIALSAIGLMAQPATGFVPDVNKLIDETQKSSNNEDLLRMVWWIPTEYWVAFAATSEQGAYFDQIIEVLDDYVIVAVIDGQIGYFGGITYTTRDSLLKHITITNSRGDVFDPLAESEIDADTRSMFDIMRPIFTNMLGAMGENFQFVVFPAKDVKQKQIVDPVEEGEFTVSLYDEQFRWRLPLGSLIPEKKCPVDGEKMSGAWKYCPYHGKGLE